MYYLLWRTGGLIPGHLLSRRTSELLAPASTGTLPPLRTIPFPTRSPWASGRSPAAGGNAPVSPAPLTPEVAGNPRTTLPAASPDDTTRLRGRSLGVPVAGLAASRLQDTFAQARGSRRHEALDLLAARGTPVVAVDRGPVVKLFTSREGGLTVYQFDDEGTYCYYYAHLDHYAPTLREGMMLEKGDPVGAVGTTGNASPDAPHLHFAIFKLGAERQWWRGEPINPYPIFGGGK